jgi:hypothetical protein
MMDYKKRAAKIIARRDAALAKKRRLKKALYRYSVPAAALCAVVTVCVGTWLLWDNDTITNTSNSVTVIHSGKSAENTVTTAVSSTAVTSGTSVTSTSVSSAVLAESLPETIDSDEYADSEQETAPVKEEEKPAVKETTAPQEVPTETVTTSVDTDIEDIIPDDTVPTIEYGQFARLSEFDDPMSVYCNITCDGINYYGYRYMKQEDAGCFYTPWKEETELISYDRRRHTEFHEPAVIYGIRSREEQQEYVIVSFTNYDMYGLYIAEEGQYEDEEYDEYEDEEELTDDELSYDDDEQSLIENE